MSTKLDYTQVIKELYNENENSLAVANVSGFVSESYVALAKANTSATIETFTYFSDVAMTQLVATLTVTYTDATKADILNVVRT